MARTPPTVPAEASPRSPRILFATHSSALSGAELALVQVLPWLKRAGVDSHICFARSGPIVSRISSDDASIHILELPVRLLERRRSEVSALRDGALLGPAVHRAARDLARICRDSKIDLVVPISMKAFAYGSLGARLARKPLVWEVHDIPLPPYFSRRAARAFRYLALLARPERILAHSQAVADSVCRLGRPVTIIPNSVRVPSEVADLPPSPPFLIGMAARLSPWKGQLVALRGLAEAVRAGAPAQLRIAGAALFGEERYEEELRSEIARLGLERHVSLIGHVDDPIAFYAGVHIGLHASTVPEPFGLSILDALAAARPVVASSAGGPIEILDAGSGSLLVPPEDPVALSRAILDLLAEGSEGLRRRGALARMRALQFSDQVLGPRIADFYLRSALASKQSSLVDDRVS